MDSQNSNTSKVDVHNTLEALQAQYLQDPANPQRLLALQAAYAARARARTQPAGPAQMTGAVQSPESQQEGTDPVTRQRSIIANPSMSQQSINSSVPTQSSYTSQRDMNTSSNPVPSTHMSHRGINSFSNAPVGNMVSQHTTGPYPPNSVWQDNNAAVHYNIPPYYHHGLNPSFNSFTSNGNFNPALHGQNQNQLQLQNQYRNQVQNQPQNQFQYPTPNQSQALENGSDEDSNDDDPQDQGDDSLISPINIRIVLPLNIVGDNNEILFDISNNASRITQALGAAMKNGSLQGMGWPMIDEDGRPRPINISVEGGINIMGNANRLKDGDVDEGEIVRVSENGGGEKGMGDVQQKQQGDGQMGGVAMGVEEGDGAQYGKELSTGASGQMQEQSRDQLSGTGQRGTKRARME